MKAAALLAAGIVALGIATASADGEVGLVIQIGDEIETHCVAYSGSSTNGEQVLRAAGKSFEQYGGSGGRTVCAIDQTGCFNASSFDSCFCECKGRECTYWGFFTRKYGAGWVYSSLGFNLLAAEDGDLHGWKWGAGGPSSAPVPADITFEQVCGHPPRSSQPQATATIAPPTPPPTAAPANASSTPAPTQDVVQPQTAVPTTPATATNTPGPTAPVVVTIGQTPEPPATAVADDGGSSNAGLIAFGAIAGTLIAFIAAAAIWRRSDGA